MQRKGSASQQCEFNNQLLTPRYLVFVEGINLLQTE